MRYRTEFHLHRCIVSPLQAKNPQILPHLQLQYSLLVLPCKMNAGTQIPYPQFLSSNNFMTKSRSESLSLKSVTDKQTDKHLTFCPPPSGNVRSPSLAKLGIMIVKVSTFFSLSNVVAAGQIFEGDHLTTFFLKFVFTKGKEDA